MIFEPRKGHAQHTREWRGKRDYKTFPTLLVHSETRRESKVHSDWRRVRRWGGDISGWPDVRKFRVWIGSPNDGRRGLALLSPEEEGPIRLPPAGLADERH